MDSNSAFGLLEDLLEESQDDNEGSDGESDIDEAVVRNFTRDSEDQDLEDDNFEGAVANPAVADQEQVLVDLHPGPWSEDLHNVTIEDFNEPTGPPPELLHLLGNAEAHMFFLEFFPEILFTKMAFETNRYAAQSNAPASFVNVTAQEMKLFLFINIMFGLHQLPAYSHYWSTDPLLGVPAVSSCMPRLRYEKISKYFHLNNNLLRFPRDDDRYDPIFKVRPVYETVRMNCIEKFRPGRDISVDEAMIAFTGRLHFKQYIKGKPTPWGVKVWCIADQSGYLLDFEVYTGKGAVSTNGLGCDVVMVLCTQYLFKYHHIFYDNYFSSVNLAT